MSDNVWKSWERFLKPENLKANLIISSLFITSYEILKDSIITRIRNFFTNGLNEKGWIVDKEYQTEVKSLNKSLLYASLEWLKNMKAIDNNDIEEFNEIKKCRNELAHEIVNFITRGSTINPLPLFPKMINLLDKIEKWWILNVEIELNPNLNDKEIDKKGIVPGPIIMLRVLMDIALGNEKESSFYYNGFKEQEIN
jgi:hypothetical protein